MASVICTLDGVGKKTILLYKYFRTLFEILNIFQGAEGKIYFGFLKTL